MFTQSRASAAMSRRSLLSLLLLLLLVFGYGPRPSLARCTATNPTEVYEGEKEITAQHSERGKAVYVTSFSVRPSSGFQSVNLTATAEAEKDGSKQTVLFSHLITADKCFKNDEWMKVSMWALLGKDPTLEFRVGDCWKECRADLGTATTGKLTLRWLNVTARGRSEWTKEVLGCIKQLDNVNRSSNISNCSTQILQSLSSLLPHASTPTPPSSPSKVVVAIVVVVSVVVVTGAMLVLIGVCLRKKKKRNATVTDAAASSTRTEVRDNSTYQASSGQHAAVGDTARVIENEIYEPFSYGEGAAGRTTEVIENELYESFSYGKSTAGGTLALSGTKEVHENELYEPFSYTQTPLSGRTKNNFYESVVEGEMEEDTQDDIYEIL
ncbi:uncharacterized protein LOC126981842 isoform X6 [Eriocheir sinensis]|uniref:uncharacterized protein LOC126981842 isoform X6 n=1 Tax=Eriocheir sinensis TaxID=95602 RepID=UPI0021C84843|nr:uncharacterized protein LOC126981842 isoform X6 [Eriocheir sinensis]